MDALKEGSSLTRNPIEQGNWGKMTSIVPVHNTIGCKDQWSDSCTGPQHFTHEHDSQDDLDEASWSTSLQSLSSLLSNNFSQGFPICSWYLRSRLQDAEQHIHVWANTLCVQSGQEKDIQSPDFELASTWMRPFFPGDGFLLTKRVTTMS